jgi:hypothetical protein
MADRVGQRLGSYRLIRSLGRGGLAEVYLGEHLHLGTQAALKILDAQPGAQDVEDFLREARTIARLNHPHIVRVLDCAVTDETLFLVMEYAPNGTLRHRHPRGQVVPLEISVSYIQQIASALQYAHDRKLVHRDIKPENMLLSARDTVLLSDFGIATIAQSSSYQQGENVAGTIAYMAPEQLQGKPRPASDQYALGVVVYEWLSGSRPFQGSWSEIASQHLLAPPPPLHKRQPDLPPQVEAVVLKALTKDPGERFASVLAFASALEQAAERAIGAHPQPELTSAPPDVEAPTNLAAALPLAMPTQPRGETPTIQAVTQVALRPPAELVEQRDIAAEAAQTAIQGAEERTSRPVEKPPAGRSRRTQGGKRRTAFIAASMALVVLALATLFASEFALPMRTVNAPATATAQAAATYTAEETTLPQTSTAQTQALNATATATVLAPYHAAVPGPCGADKDGWMAQGNVTCLPDAVRLAPGPENKITGIFFDRVLRCP